MYKKLHCSVRLVFALSCIFCLLFSNTLSVRASSGVNHITDLVQFTNPILSTGNTYFTFKVPHRQISNSVFVNRSFDVTISPTIDTSTIEIDPYKTYCIYLSTNGSNPTATFSGNQTINYNEIKGGSIVFKTINGRNLSLLNNTGNYIYRGYALVQGIELLNGYNSSVNTTCNFTCNVSFDCHLAVTGNISGNEYWTVRLPYSMDIYNLKDGYQYMNTTDMETKRQIQQSEQVIDNTLQEGNEIASDTNETTHSIFDSISSFFGSFFNNLIGVFVPEDGFFTTWFNNLNTLLTQKLGILYYPFSVFIDICNRLVTAVAGNQNNDPVIYFPELKINVSGQSYTILERQEVHLSNYAISLQNADTSNSPMFGLNNLIHVIRRFSDIVLTLLMFQLLRQKLNLIIKGEDYDN